MHDLGQVTEFAQFCNTRLTRFTSCAPGTMIKRDGRAPVQSNSQVIKNLVAEMVVLSQSAYSTGQGQSTAVAHSSKKAF